MALDTILTQLVAADRRACGMVDDAEESLELTVAGIEREIEQFKITYAEKAQRRIGIVRDTEQKASEEASGNIAQRYDSLMQNLETVYAERHTQWEEELFKRCTTR